MTTTEPTKPITDPLGHEEDGDYALRLQLGLRPVAFPDTQVKGTHPDQRPCPSWCWVGQHEEYDHEIDPDSPFVARHDYEPRISFPATMYKGRKNTHGSETLVEVATLEAQMYCYGSQIPKISIALRYVDVDDRQNKYVERLKLTIDDAQDLISTLRHLIEVATPDLLA